MNTDERIQRLEYIVIRLNRRIKEIEKQPIKRKKSKTSQPLTLWGDIPADALTSAGTPIYIPPFARHYVLPKEFEGFVTNKPVRIRSLTQHLRKKYDNITSDRVRNVYRAAGYTIMRIDNEMYTNAKGIECFPLAVIPLNRQ